MFSYREIVERNHIKTSNIKIPIKNKFDCTKDISEVISPDTWLNKRCLILAGGTSLENFDFNRIQNELTIGVNKAFIKYPVTINYAMDYRFFDLVSTRPKSYEDEDHLYEKWLKFKGMKVFFRQSNKYRFNPSIITVKNLLYKVISLDVSKGIWGGSNSGFGSLMLAIALGATKISLLGYDFYVSGKKTHFHSGYKGQNLQSFPKKLLGFMRDFEEFAPAIEKLGIKIVNLNEKSNLKCFPISTLDHFLE